MPDRVLVVSAHADDESFGCLGTLLNHLKDGAVFAFLWFTWARKTNAGAEQAAHYFEAEHESWQQLEDQKLDTYPLVRIITPIEHIVQEFRPTIVYTNFIADLNRDHRIVSEAVMVACRPYKPKAPEVWMYRIPGTTALGFREFKADKINLINRKAKELLIKEWYPGEMENDRDDIGDYERFEKWPRVINGNVSL